MPCTVDTPVTAAMPPAINAAAISHTMLVPASRMAVDYRADVLGMNVALACSAATPYDQLR